MDMDPATMQTVSVVSPCDLHAGYVFVANVNGQKVRVTVPEGGVKQGQVFDIAIAAPASARRPLSSSRTSSESECNCCSPENKDVEKQSAVLSKTAAAVPAGEWKDGVCDCFTYGILHPTVWNALCCPQVLMKQLSNRLSGAEAEVKSGVSGDSPLASCGCATGESKGDGSSAAGYKRGTTLFLVACVVDFLLIAPILEATTTMARDGGDGSNREGSTAHNSMSLGTQCFYVLWTLALTSIAIYSVVQLRAAVRAKYGIRTGKCGPCEDLCCVVCCHGCTLAQLARQTADYDDEETAAHCCTVDGLSGSKRLNPCLFL